MDEKKKYITYGCNVADEETKEKIRKYVLGLSGLLSMTPGEFLQYVIEYFIEQKGINLEELKI